MVSISFNPYTWHSTKERVNSDVLVLNLKNDNNEMLEVSSLDEEIVIVVPLKPQTPSKEKSWYFIKKDELRFHEINVTHKNTLLILEILPQDPTVHLLVYMRFGQRPTTQEYDLNATISHSGNCVWKPTAQGKKEGETECSLNPLTPIEALAKRPGKYYLGFLSVVVKDTLVSSAVYDSKTYQNYTLKVTSGSCVFWSDKHEMWITTGCRVGV